jgi:hypothetical protein
VTSLVALTGLKFVGAIALLFGLVAPTVHLLFELAEASVPPKPGCTW